MRPIQIWVPDVRSPEFEAEAHRQSLAVAAGARAEDAIDDLVRDYWFAVPALVATALFALIFTWNEFTFAVLLSRGRVTTLPFILPTLMESHNILWGDIAAIATIGALPVVIIAFALQRYLVRGLSFGAIKST